MSEEDILRETFIPALRYYLPRHTASAMAFTYFAKTVWHALSEEDRAVAILDIVEELDDGAMWSTERDAWRKFLRWSDEGDDDE